MFCHRFADPQKLQVAIKKDGGGRPKLPRLRLFPCLSMYGLRISAYGLEVADELKFKT